eukprot:5904112-Prymnesium_polylepis.1
MCRMSVKSRFRKWTLDSHRVHFDQADAARAQHSRCLVRVWTLSTHSVHSTKIHYERGFVDAVSAQ